MSDWPCIDIKARVGSMLITSAQCLSRLLGVQVDNSDLSNQIDSAHKLHERLKGPLTHPQWSLVTSSLFLKTQLQEPSQSCPEQLWSYIDYTGFRPGSVYSRYAWNERLTCWQTSWTYILDHSKGEHHTKNFKSLYQIGKAIDEPL